MTVTDVNEIIAGIRRPERTVYICTRGDLLAEWDELEHALEVAEANPPSSLGETSSGAAIAQRMEELQRQIRDAQIAFRIKGVSDRALSDLIAAHPSKEENILWDSATFAPALISAAAVEPQITPEQAVTLLESLARGEARALFNAAWEASTSAVDVPFSRRASAILHSTSEK